MKICNRYLRLFNENEWIKLLDKYTEDKLFKRSEDGRLIKQFYIPPEIIKSNYKTSRTLIDKDHGWASRGLDRILKFVTNGELSSKDYIDIFMYRILDGIGPRCSRCGRPIEFTGKISCPYWGVHCSRSCGTSDMNDRLWNMKNSPFRNEKYKNLKKQLASDMAKDGRIGLTNKSCSLSNTLSMYSKYDTMYFYIIRDENKFKIGISHIVNAKNRLYVSKIHKFDKLNSSYSIYLGKTEDIIRLENEIKFNNEFMNNRYYEKSSTEGWMETFHINMIDKVFLIINKYKINEITD